MIDTHVHVVPPSLPGAGPLSPTLEEGAARKADVLRREMSASGVHTALAVGRQPADAADPLGVTETLAVARLLPGLYAVGVLDPTRDDADHLRRVEAMAAARQVVAFLAYLGAFPFGPGHAGYRPYYEMAERHRLPVLFHSAKLYSPRARLLHTHPLLVDEVAVDHPRVSFVLGHGGSPWLLDTAEVVARNFNVWADLSCLLPDTREMAPAEQEDRLAEARTRLGGLLRQTRRPNRFLHGSGWPLAPMAAARAFLAAAIPADHHEQVFEENAVRLFRL